MSLRAVLFGCMVFSVALAGCTGGDDPPVTANPADPDSLKAGTGAIAGLLVDDRFRPIHLVDGQPTTEFQATGFILIQETATKILSNDNGEFTVADLEPGKYTLRLNAQGHEAIVKQVNVNEGEFTEATIEARRVINDAGTILTQEHSMYIACAADYFANGGNLPCDGDLSVDSYSSSFSTNYADLGEQVSFMITEMLANQEKGWEIQLRGSQDGGESTTYFAAELNYGDYVRVVLERGGNADDHQDNPGYNDRYGGWQNVGGFSTILFVDHPYREEHQQFDGGALCCGVGFSAGIKAKFLQIVFLGEPEGGIDPDTYCVLCG